MTIAFANNNVIQPIETMYRGNRCRSRLEAKWLVFLDAAGVEFVFEPEGYTIGNGYLVDLWMPKLKTFGEIKPSIEEAGKAYETVQALANVTENSVLLIAGYPQIDSHPPMALIPPCSLPVGTLSPDDLFSWRSTSWQQCQFCDQVNLGVCECNGPLEILRKPHASGSGPRVEHAMAEAQRARFEYGEDGQPRPYVVSVPTLPLNVYAAGSVLETRTDTNSAVVQWRKETFGEDPSIGSQITGRFHYAGPTIVQGHDGNFENLAENCLREVSAADALFAWIDRLDTVGTIAEIGAAYPHKPIFMAFANEELSRQFYFVEQLASVSVIAPTVRDAWEFFTKWQNSWTFAKASRGPSRPLQSPARPPRRTNVQIEIDPEAPMYQYGTDE